MKNIFLAILIVFYGGSNLLAAIPNWSVNPADYSGSMVMVGVMSFDGVESLDGNDIVGAFIGTEVRGVANLQYEAAADRYIAYLIIYGNTSGGTITFKMYDADQDVEINALNNATFQVNGSQGNLGSPFLWSDVVARDASELLSFGFEGSVSEEIIGTDVNIIIPNQMELSALVGVFTISPGASLWLGNVPQVSGNSVNDFSDAVELKVIAENGTDFTNYSINVTQSVNPSPTDIEVAFGNTIENNAIDDVMATLSAVDDAEDSHFFSLVSGSGDSHNSLFEISNNQVLAKAVFDFESRSTYAIRIQVTDSDNQTFAKSVEVTITDVNESPSLTGAAYSLPENSAVGVLVTTLIATDPEGDVLEFSLIGGNGAFSLDTNTGDLKVASEGLLDFETTPQFVLTATVSDGSLSSTSEIIVNLTDVVENTRNTAPVVSDVTFSITENSVNNFFVGTIDATDAEGNRLTYAITAGNDLGGFSIGAASGVLLVADQTVLDFETNADFTLTVEVSDGELTSTATVAINLTDVDENVNQAPIIANQTFTVNEHSVVGFVIGTVAANDPNGDLLSYSLAEASSVIFLHQGSGQLSVLDPTALDFETSPQLTYQLTVSDGSLAATATITIDLIDIDESVNQAPQISDQIFTLLENSPAGFEVGTVSAGDPNGDAIVFSLSGGENAFLIDANTGVITIEDSVLVDYEINIQFVLTVTASDGDLSSTATVIINVSDLDESVNTAPSVTDQTFMIAENSVNNLFIGTIDATDAESNRLTYAITAGNDLGGFSLAVETGVLIVADQDQLDFEINPNFALTVAVSDGEFISDLTVTINLTNVEEKVNQAPTIADQSFSIDENSAIGSIVGQISGDDPDGDKIIFSLVNVSQVFTINAASGEIIALNTEALDFEISRSFFLEVNATDGSLTSSAMITININDIDENVLSVEETIGFDIYPNPTVDWINVISSEEVDFIACYDLQGTKLISSFTKEIDVSHLKAGVYLLYVHQSSGLKASRFIKR